MTRVITAAAAAALALLLPACGDGGRLPTYPVTGKVFFGQAPADGALVVYHPTTPLPEGTPRPRGKVGPDGTYKLTTYDGDDGAPEGTYQVTVEWYHTPNPDAGPVNRLPARYSRPAHSGIEAKVGKGPTEANTITLKP